MSRAAAEPTVATSAGPREALVCLPTYNEAENLATVVTEVLSIAPVDVLVIDDNSPDGTGELAEGLSRQHPGRVHVLHRPGKQGLGRAYIAGFRWALERPYRYVLEMDADLSHQPRSLVDLLAAVRDHDLVLGSRLVEGGGTENWNLLRRLISRGGSLYARTILGLDVRDLTGGFKCFRREVLEALDLDSVDCSGYAFQIELTHRAIRRGFRVTEVPIVFQGRAEGTSKMGPRIFLEAVVKVWGMRLRTG
jgi:dolichol-phosphate mannosyltransferase